MGGRLARMSSPLPPRSGLPGELVRFARKPGQHFADPEIAESKKTIERELAGVEREYQRADPSNEYTRKMIARRRDSLRRSLSLLARAERSE